MATAKKTPATPTKVAPVKPPVKKAAAPKPAAEPTEAKPKTRKGFKIPKLPAAAADLLFNTRNQRLTLNKDVEAMKAEEHELREYFVNTLPANDATGIAGKAARVTVDSKDVPQVEDIKKVRAYVLKEAAKNPGVWAIFTQAVNETALKEMKLAGVKVPGIKWMKVKFLRVNKV